MAVIQKVFAYITHGERLLVFSHPNAPEAGIQVPAGSVEPGELLEAAVMREAGEETGLAGLELISFLGEQIVDLAALGRDEIHHRYFYHLCCTSQPPDAWRHYELTPSDGSPAPIPLDFCWAPLPDGVPALQADHDKLLPVLIERLFGATG